MSVFLADAEDRAMRGSDGRVQPWLDDLRDLVYDIEVRSLLPGCCADLGPKTVTFHRELRSRMEKIDGQLESILKRKMDLRLTEKLSGLRADNYERMTDSLPENFVVGRQDDKRVILAKLLNEVDDRLSVIPIVGMGGVGKKITAKSVFNDPSVVEPLWACVSHKFNMLEIARALLGSLGSDATYWQ